MNADHGSLDLTSTPLDGATEVAAAGEVDLATAGELVDAVRAALDAGDVVLDLQGVTFMDSSGVRALEALLRAADEVDGSLAIRAQLAPNVRQVLTLTGLLDVLPLRERA